MGYDLTALNPELTGDDRKFHFGAFSWGPLIDACGYLFPVIQNGGQWYCVWGADDRMPVGDTYPRLLSNDGFTVSAEEAKIMARCARNFVTIQRSLPEANRSDGTIDTQVEFTREDVEKMLLRAMSGAPPGPWPRKIRDDFVDRYERFAAWAERSGGFEIW